MEQNELLEIFGKWAGDVHDKRWLAVQQVLKVTEETEVEAVCGAVMTNEQAQYQRGRVAMVKDLVEGLEGFRREGVEWLKK